MLLDSEGMTSTQDTSTAVAAELRSQADIDINDLSADELNLLVALAEDEGPRQAVEAFLEGDVQV